MFHWPLAERTRLTLGSVRAMRENSTCWLQSERRRRLARTWLARRIGSEPKPGSSSTTKFCSVKPGMGSRLRVMLSKWTGRPSEALILRATRR